MNCNLALVFRPEEFAEAQDTFIDYFETDNPTGEVPDGVIYDGLDPTLWVNMASVTIPALAGLIAIWLGKGKTVKCERRKGNSRETVSIVNHDPQSTIDILRAFLNDDQ